MVFAGNPAAKKPRLGIVAIDSEGRTLGEYRKQAKEENAQHNHAKKYGFLQDIRDHEGRTPDDKDYDPRKLFVPDASLAAMTNFERQYWEIKMTNWDTVLFFKKGKFYELYERDADIGHQDFDLKMVDSARSSMRMVGLPEQGFSMWAARFIGAGHKVGRVEQMQTRTQLDREGSKTAVVPRELCQVLTLGTLTELDMFMDHTPHYIVSMKEASSSYGIVVADTSRGIFRFAYLPEDEHRSELVTLLHSTKPKEILLERGHVSKVAAACIDKELGGSVRKTSLTSKTEFPTAADAKKHFAAVDFFPTSPLLPSLAPFWDNELVMSAFGALALYLSDSKQDRELLSLQNFGKYDPSAGGTALTLDGTALANLEVLENAFKGKSGTLLSYLSNCTSPMGRRLLHQWVCSPLRRVDDIVLRQDAVAELVDDPHKRGLLQKILSKIPDLERYLNRLGMAGREREVAWVDPLAYNKKIVKIFTDTLTALGEVQARLEDYQGSFSSALLEKLVNFAPAAGAPPPAAAAAGTFPHMQGILDAFEKKFDLKQAVACGEVAPYPGANPAYDEATKDEEIVAKELEGELRKCVQYYKDRNVKFAHLGKEHYMVEVPAGALKGKALYPGFEEKTVNKTGTRYVHTGIRSLVSRAAEAKDQRDAVKRSVLKSVLIDFSKEAAVWERVIHTLAALDCLCALAVTSSQVGMCRPVVRERRAGEKPLLRIKNMVHPLVRPAVGSKADNVVPNDVTLGGGEAPLVALITGPNMGGKSTVMRSACVAIIFAQLGCYVPAESVELTPVDRVFTRIGAMDRILSGLSTFMVEMKETAAILKNATEDSFVVLDELGRGTATVDGYSIACSVLIDIAQRSVFHFPIGLYRMAYEIDAVTRTVTFLYKFIEGASNESYGVDVAKKANLPTSILDRAQVKAREYQSNNSYQGDNVVQNVSRLVRAAIESKDPVARRGVKRKLDDWAEMQ
eukprot:gene18012-27737_t